MASEATWPGSAALIRRLREIQAAARPGSKAVTKANKDIRQIVIDDNRDKLLRSVDRYGKPLAPLRKGRALTACEIAQRGGNGPPLIPKGVNSNAIVKFLPTWETVGGEMVLVGKWTGMLTKKGFPYMIYHISKEARKLGKDGTPILPKRDVAGITPKGWYQVIQRHKALAGEILKSGGGR